MGRALKSKAFLLYLLLLTILSCSLDLDLGAKPFVAMRNLATETPAVVVDGMAGHGIANPRVLFSSQKPAQYVFSSWYQICGIGKDLEFGCWSKNWLDTTQQWNHVIVDNVILVWDTTEVFAINPMTFDTLYRAPFIDSQLWGLVSMTRNSPVIQSVRVISKSQLIIGTDHQLYTMGPTGEAELLHEFQTPVTSVLWERTQGEWCVLNNASQVSGAVDSLACVRDGILNVYPTDLVRGAQYTKLISPTLWAGAYVWLLCDGNNPQGCSVSSTMDGITWKMLDRTSFHSWLFQVGFASIPLESKMILAYTSYDDAVDYRESMYNFVWYAVDRNGAVIDNSTISWKMDAFYEIKAWQTSAGKIAVSFIGSQTALVGSQTAKVYLFNQKGDLVE